MASFVGYVFVALFVGVFLLIIVDAFMIARMTGSKLLGIAVFLILMPVLIWVAFDDLSRIRDDGDGSLSFILIPYLLLIGTVALQCVVLKMVPAGLLSALRSALVALLLMLKVVPTTLVDNVALLAAGRQSVVVSEVSAAKSLLPVGVKLPGGRTANFSFLGTRAQGHFAEDLARKHYSNDMIRAHVMKPLPATKYGGDNGFDLLYCGKHKGKHRATIVEVKHIKAEPRSNATEILTDSGVIKRLANMRNTGNSGQLDAASCLQSALQGGEIARELIALQTGTTFFSRYRVAADGAMEQIPDGAIEISDAIVAACEKPTGAYTCELH